MHASMDGPYLESSVAISNDFAQTNDLPGAVDQLAEKDEIQNRQATCRHGEGDQGDKQT